MNRRDSTRSFAAWAPLLLAALAASPSAAAPTLDASRVQRTTQAEWSPATIFPQAVAPPRRGRVVGLLVPRGDWPVGRFEPALGAELRLHQGKAAPSFTWFEIEPHLQTTLPTQRWPLKGIPGGRPVQVAQVPASLAHVLGLTAPLELVRAKVVPSCAGKAPCDRVVLTDVEPVGPRVGMALPAAQVVEALGARFEAERADRAGEVEALRASARAKVPKTFVARPRPVTTQRVWLTWHPDERQLELLVVWRAVQHFDGPLETVHIPCRPCPCTPDGRCAPCVACVPRTEQRRDQRRVGHTLGARYVVDRRARLVREVIYLPQPAN